MPRPAPPMRPRPRRTPPVPQTGCLLYTSIAQEYAEKIRRAQEEGNYNEVLRLGRQQKEETAAAEIASLKADIDWDGLFGNFGGLLEEQLRPTLVKLRKYAASDEYRNAGAEDKQVISELIAKLEDRSAGGINRNTKISSSNCIIGRGINFFT